jgi:prepilin-type N-terminal cleavage/methylation domain-containing protein
MAERRALTLIEVLVVIAIVGALLALLLPAVIMVRASALRTQSMSNLRQCNLALHNFADAHGFLPTLDGEPYMTHEGDSFLFALLPYVEEENYYNQCKATGMKTSAYMVRMYLSPADPTLSNLPALPNGLASYGVNAFAFQKECRLGEMSFPDGLSQTIAFAEHYAINCQNTGFSWFFPKPLSLPLPSGVMRHAHRATFAEPRALDTIFGTQFPPDVYPITTGTPPTTTGSVPGLTFQVRPKIEDCNPQLAQTPHASGMLAGFLDGSVRTLGPQMAPTVYWALVTPSGGETIADW